MPIQRDFDRRSRTGSQEIDLLLRQVFELLPPEDTDLIGEIVANAVRLALAAQDRGDLKVVAGAVRELRRTFRAFEPYKDVRKVTVFGSARTKPGDPNYELAKEFGAKMNEQGWMIITGGGPGIMEAANEGAGREGGFGLQIRLPFEQSTIELLRDDPKLLKFRYFFTRKLAFVMEADAFAFFPGGFGTMDEVFETLTLIQTGKSLMCPVVMLGAEGEQYWARFEDFVRTEFLDAGLISEQDFSLFSVTTEPSVASRELTHFYENYRSQRYIGDDLYLRLNALPGADELDRINEDFKDFLKSGRIRTVQPHPVEIAGDDDLDCQRLAFHFDRHSHGRLRELINRLNDVVTA